MKKFTRTLTAALLLTLQGVSALAQQTVTFTSTTSGAPTWNRPVAGNPPVPPVSGVGTAVGYSVMDFTVASSGAYSITSAAISPNGWDNYTFLYATSFNPAAQFANVLIGNDDAPTIGLSGFNVNLTAGTQYFLVNTGFGNGDAGIFTTAITGLSAAALGSAPPPLPGGLLSSVHTGTTSGAPTWNRPVAGNPPVPPVSGVGTAVGYSVYDFYVTASGNYDIVSAAQGGWDNYTFLYATSFNPAAQFANVLIGNDDAPTVGLSGFNVNLTAGTQYFLVTTGFGNSDAGSFFNTIVGPGSVYQNAAVPEPGSLALVGGLVALGSLALRRRRAAC